MAGIPLSSGFNLQSGLALDLRTTKATTTARDAILAVARFEGLAVYVEADKLTYQLQGGLTNSDWVEVGGTGIENLSYNPISNKIEATVPIQTTLNSFYLGDHHKMSSGGENIWFTNIQSNISYSPCWSEIKDQSIAANQGSSGVTHGTVRKYDTSLTNTVFGQAYNSTPVDYEITYTPTSNESVYGIGIIPTVSLRTTDVIRYSIHEGDINGTVVFFQTMTSISTGGTSAIYLWFDHPHEQLAGAEKTAHFEYVRDGVTTTMPVYSVNGDSNRAYIRLYLRYFNDYPIATEGAAIGYAENAEANSYAYTDTKVSGLATTTYVDTAVNKTMVGFPDAVDGGTTLLGGWTYMLTSDEFLDGGYIKFDGEGVVTIIGNGNLVYTGRTGTLLYFQSGGDSTSLYCHGVSFRNDFTVGSCIYSESNSDTTIVMDSCEIYAGKRPIYLQGKLNVTFNNCRIEQLSNAAASPCVSLDGDDSDSTFHFNGGTIRQQGTYANVYIAGWFGTCAFTNVHFWWIYGGSYGTWTPIRCSYMYGNFGVGDMLSVHSCVFDYTYAACIKTVSTAVGHWYSLSATDLKFRRGEFMYDSYWVSLALNDNAKTVSPIALHGVTQSYL